MIRRRRRSFIGFFRNLSVVGWLVSISLVASFIAFFLFANPDSELINNFALKSTNILQGKYLWSLITHIFVHGSFVHLFVNMFVLFSLGSLCEKIIGRKRFLWFYLVSGLFAGGLSVVLTGYFGNTEFGSRVFGSPDIYMVGASGAIFAIAGLYVILLPKLRFSIIFFPFFSLPAYIMIPAVLFIMWGLSAIFSWPIGNVAHFGGFLAGIVYGYYLKTKYKRKVDRLQRMFR